VTIENFRLRPATAADAAKIRDLIHRVHINPFDLNWEHFLVAETREGKFIGCSQLKPHGRGVVELASLAIEEEYRGHGVARALIESLVARSPRPLYLMCRPLLVPLYEKFGFRKIGTDGMPAYFRRIQTLARMAGALARSEGPAIMRKDS
jgi:N-acetylglutamate synthase-like GNAT family acetyltransferase